MQLTSGMQVFTPSKFSLVAHCRLTSIRLAIFLLFVGNVMCCKMF